MQTILRPAEGSPQAATGFGEVESTKDTTDCDSGEECPMQGTG